MTDNVSASSAAVLLVGLSFRSAPVALLEKVSAAVDDLPAVEQSLLGDEVISEAMAISTCNRMEFYTVSSAFHSGLEHILTTVADRAGVSCSDLEAYVYVLYGDAAAQHMLKVASGLDSMVIGEQQILGQLRAAYQESSEAQTVGGTLHDLTQRALHTGKRVHSETNIDAAGSSMVTFAINEALATLDIPGATSASLSGYRAIIVGAGAMASLASTYIGQLGIDHVTVANRTVDRAETLAAHATEAGVSARGVGLDQIPEELLAADIIVSATGAVGTVVEATDVAVAQRHRAGRRQVYVDLSMPKDVAAETADVPGVSLLNIEELATKTEDSAADEDAALAIVDSELASFLDELRAQAVVPTVKAMRQQAMERLETELAQLERQTPEMSASDRKAVQKSMRRLVEKMLHTPTVQAKKLSAGGKSVSYSEALAALFNLSSGVTQTVTTSSETKASAAQRAAVGSQGVTAADARRAFKNATAVNTPQSRTNRAVKPDNKGDSAS